MFQGKPLPAFPASGGADCVNAQMAAHGLGVRSAHIDDLPYLRKLYHALRHDQLASTGWPESFVQNFLDSQFDMQHMHYVGANPNADYWLVEHAQRPVGRYYLLRESPHYRIIDITLEPSWRGQGLGSLLLQWTQSLAQQHGALGIDLHVDEGNVAAQRLYARLGFIETMRESPYIAMHWPAALS
jgi:ribosomal protein S18 acetylase RimI-like enzyme